MKKILVIGLCLGMMGCAAHGQFRPAGPVSGTPYLTVYGTETCSGCKGFRRALDKKDIPYTFKNIRDEAMRYEMYSRMEVAGLNTRNYLIPVVDVNGELAAFPSVDDTLERYHR